MHRYVLSVSRCLIPAFMTACLSGGALAQQGHIADKRTPFTKLLCIGSSPCVSDVGDVTTPALPEFFVVPPSTASGEAVRELVIEFASGDCIGTGRTTRVDIFGTGGPAQLADTGDNLSSNTIPMSVAQFNDSLNTNAVQSFAQRTQLTYVPGTTISISYDVSQAGSITCKVQLNGHFVTG